MKKVITKQDLEKENLEKEKLEKEIQKLEKETKILSWSPYMQPISIFTASLGIFLSVYFGAPRISKLQDEKETLTSEIKNSKETLNIINDSLSLVKTNIDSIHKSLEIKETEIIKLKSTKQEISNRISDLRLKNITLINNYKLLINNYRDSINKISFLKFLKEYNPIEIFDERKFKEHKEKIDSKKTPLGITVIGYPIFNEIIESQFSFSDLFLDHDVINLEKVAEIKQNTIVNDSLIIKFEIKDSVANKFASPLYVELRDPNNNLIFYSFYSVKKMDTVTKKNCERCKYESIAVSNISKLIKRSEFIVIFGFINQYSIDKKNIKPLFYSKTKKIVL